MQVELKAYGTDLADSLQGYIERRLSLNAGRFFDQVIRIRVRVSGLNGPRGGTRTSCRISIDVKSLGKLVVQESDLDAHAAIDRAAARLGRGGMALFFDGPGDSDRSLVFESQTWVTKGAEESSFRDGGAGLQRRGGRGHQDEAPRGVQLRRGRGVRETGEEQSVSPRSRSL